MSLPVALSALSTITTIFASIQFINRMGRTRRLLVLVLLPCACANFILLLSVVLTSTVGLFGSLEGVDRVYWTARIH